MPIKITITDDRGHSKEFDFDAILTREHNVPPDQSIHALIMQGVKAPGGSELRMRILQEHQDEMVKQFVLDYLMICDRCQAHVLHDHGWVRERVPGDERSEEIVCDNCVSPPDEEVDRRKNGPPPQGVCTECGNIHVFTADCVTSE